MLQAVPVPDLRIIPTTQIIPHEQHDQQRALPLLHRIQTAELFTNPPIVAAAPNGEYVVLDGANRHHVFSELQYPHLLVQVVDYESEQVTLSRWQHVVSRLPQVILIDHLDRVPGLKLNRGWHGDALAHIILREGITVSVQVEDGISLQERNRTLCDVVQTYRDQAHLDRTHLQKPEEIWPIYPEASALVLFPLYQPRDIIAAAVQQAYLPPGISRHIIQGRALRLNYSMDILRDTEQSTEQKNADLQAWMLDRFASKGARFYAESTYLFDE